MLWKVLYNIIVLPIGLLLLHVAAYFDGKARRAIVGRKHLFERLRDDLSKTQPGRKRLWFHSSSMGEFEQAKPIITELKMRHPEIEIVVSFFSPSGYEHSRAYKFARVITYMPFDTRGNAERFVEILNPSAAIMVRYDLWPNHIWALKRASVPIFIANATLRQNTARRLPLINQFHCSMYDAIDYILTVSESDKKVFESFRLHHPEIEVMGDTRYDQVWQRSSDSKTRHVLPKVLVENRRIIVAGSSWEEDEEALLPAFHRLAEEDRDLLLVLVPHEPNLENVERIESQLNGNASHIRFSSLNDYVDERVVIIDSVGILMALYQYAHVAYVGGSFRQGVHNVLEPAAYGIPIVIGPKYQNSQEAIELVRREAAFVGENPQQLYEHFHALLRTDTKREKSGSRALELVQHNIGATKRFLSYLEKVL